MLNRLAPLYVVIIFSIILLMPGKVLAYDYGVCAIAWPDRTIPELRTTAVDERFIIHTYTPLPVDYPKLEEVAKPQPVVYNVPPGLDQTQSIRWGQALPSARAYLARLYNIPKEIAKQYGAKY